jgi:hypothetical protein
LKEVQLQVKHIAQYQKTKPIYEQYKKAKDKKKFYAEHTAELIIFESSRDTLNAIRGDEKLPSLTALQQEQARLSEDQQRLYDERSRLKKEQKNIEVIKTNVDSFLSLGRDDSQQDKPFRRTIIGHKKDRRGDSLRRSSRSVLFVSQPFITPQCGLDGLQQILDNPNLVSSQSSSRLLISFSNCTFDFITLSQSRSSTETVRPLAMAMIVGRLTRVVPVSMLLRCVGESSIISARRSCVMSALIRAIFIRLPIAL